MNTTTEQTKWNKENEMPWNINRHCIFSYPNDKKKVNHINANNDKEQIKIIPKN